MVNLTVLKKHQYCVVLDPVGSDGRSRLGVKELRVGPRTFFLQPGRHEYYTQWTITSPIP